MTKASTPPPESPPDPTWEDQVVLLLDRARDGLDSLGWASPKVKWRINEWQQNMIQSRDNRLHGQPRITPEVCPSCQLVAGVGNEICPHCGNDLHGIGALKGRARRSLLSSPCRC